MRACAKGKVRIIQSLQIQTIWVFELAGVPIRCSEHEENRFSRSDSEATNFDLLFGHPASELDGAFKTQQFLDSGPGCEETSISGIGIPQDLIREEKPCGPESLALRT